MLCQHLFVSLAGSLDTFGLRRGGSRFRAFAVAIPGITFFRITVPGIAILRIAFFSFALCLCFFPGFLFTTIVGSKSTSGEQPDNEHAHEYLFHFERLKMNKRVDRKYDQYLGGRQHSLWFLTMRLSSVTRIGCFWRAQSKSTIW